MPDGVRLSARIWMPSTAAPAPAILEYIPYRKRDLVRLRDEGNHPFLAANGYVALRVDMRGSGDSEGHMPDMYSAHELDDARHVIEWIARQPWCNGKVGMFGTSWGGTASLQAAANSPGPLRAVLANCATIDRFEDDIHWMGGCLLTDSLEWGATLPAILALPPDAATVGEDWKTIWEERLEGLSMPFQHWARHDRRGEYWRHGSVRFQAASLDCPVLAIGGWADRYSNTVMRLVAARPDLCHGIVGPWGHHYPDKGEPGPAINFQQLALKWWDCWLKHDGNDRPAEFSALTVWQRQFDPPQDRLPQRAGHWLSLDNLEDAGHKALHLTDAGLDSTPQSAATTLTIPFDLRHGECAGDTGYFGRVGGLPLDQSNDDARALCFDSDVLTADEVLFGHAELSLDLNTETMPAQIACRICEVTPEGVSNLVTRTVLALDLDESLDDTRPGLPGTSQRYHITFPSMAYRFRAGNRIRLALGASYWPLVWPVSCKTPLVMATAGAVLRLPLPPVGGMVVDTPFDPPAEYKGGTDYRITAASELVRTPQTSRGKARHQSWQQPMTTTVFGDLNLEFSAGITAEYEFTGNDPATACCRIFNSYKISRQDGVALVDSSIAMQATASGYRVKTVLKASWNDEILLTKEDDREQTER